MAKEVITISSFSLKKVFRSTDHCQGIVRTWTDEYGHVHSEHKTWMGATDWVPVTARIPAYVTPRPGFTDGLIDTEKKYLSLFYEEFELISNPEPEYEPKEG